MASTTPISKTQQRVAALRGVEVDGTYAGAARALEAAGLPADGCPTGKTWRDVRAMTDAELNAALDAYEPRDLLAEREQRAAMLGYLDV